jgi:hypothetical protein
VFERMPWDEERDTGEPEDDEREEDEGTCQECGEAESECMCVCGYCLRFGTTCICDDRSDDE